MGHFTIEVISGKSAKMRDGYTPESPVRTCPAGVPIKFDHMPRGLSLRSKGFYIKEVDGGGEHYESFYKEQRARKQVTRENAKLAAELRDEEELKKRKRAAAEPKVEPKKPRPKLQKSKKA